MSNCIVYAQKSAFLFVVSTLTLGFMGCALPATTAPASSSSTPAPAPPVSVTENISGNWQGVLTAKSGTMALGILAGNIDQSGGVTSAGQFTTSVLRASSSCFTTVPSIPLQGFVSGTSVSLNSFAVDSQYIALNGTMANSGGIVTGTYAVNGGCADGGAGTFTFTRYAPLTGTYTGSATDSTGTVHTVSITSTQSIGATGGGAFDLTGKATFSGFSCFTQSTSAKGTISGSAVDLTFVTDDRAGSTIHMTGNATADAGGIASVLYAVSGGGCSGQTGTATLARQ